MVHLNQYFAHVPVADLGDTKYYCAHCDNPCWDKLGLPITKLPSSWYIHTNKERAALHIHSKTQIHRESTGYRATKAHEMCIVRIVRRISRIMAGIHKY